VNFYVTRTAVVGILIIKTEISDTIEIIILFSIMFVYFITNIFPLCLLYQRVMDFIVVSWTYTLILGMYVFLIVKFFFKDNIPDNDMMSYIAMSVITFFVFMIIINGFIKLLLEIIYPWKYPYMWKKNKRKVENYYQNNQ
jgi:hypothetical protein